MIRVSLLLGPAFVIAGLTLHLPGHAQALETIHCEPAPGAPCGHGAGSPGKSPPAPISAARSDALKKRQLVEIIRMHKSDLFREGGTVATSSPSPRDKRL